MPKPKDIPLKKCPFCGGGVIQIFDDYGGGYIEHKEGRISGSMQKCILTDVKINTSSRTHFTWDDRATDTTKRSQ